MAHQIEDSKIFYVGEKPWHGIGVKLDKPPTVADGIKAAGLDWTVSLERCQLADGRAVDAFATVRSEDNKILGVVGPKYRPLQNIDAFKFFDPFLESKAAALSASVAEANANFRSNLGLDAPADTPAALPGPAEDAEKSGRRNGRAKVTA